jgi:hypothetical protein
LRMDIKIINKGRIFKLTILPIEERGSRIFGCDIFISPVIKWFDVVH